jgi:multidrug efflux pump subunit AcrB
MLQLLTPFSKIGMVILDGVVVNDSIMLVNFVNQCIRDGMPVTKPCSMHFLEDFGLFF